MKSKRSREYLPALGFSWLTPLFDVVIAWTTREASFRRRLIEQADLARVGRVLDLGCGTGTLAVEMKRLFPQVIVAGVDADEAMLDRARRKAQAAEADILFHRGFTQALPYKDASFDRVVSTLFFHHLEGAQKDRTLKEVLRILTPGGQLHIADWGRPTGPMMRGLFLVVQMTDGFSVTRDNVAGHMPALIRQAGFVDVRECGAMNMQFGTLRFIAAAKEASPASSFLRGDAID